MTKNNEKIRGWLRLIIYAAVILVSVGIAFATLRERVNTNKGKIETIETDIVKVSENEKSIIGLKKDVEYIRKTVDRIEDKLN